VKNRPLRDRLGFAVAGLKFGWVRERSFRTQGFAALLALAALVGLRPKPIWWAVVALVTAAVLALELVNSALEGIIDLLHPGIHPEIKIVKDMLAGAVLIISLSALVVAGALVVSLL
jgi:undecaprenol kinase